MAALLRPYVSSAFVLSCRCTLCGFHISFFLKDALRMLCVMQKEPRKFRRPIESFRTGIMVKDVLVIDAPFTGDPGIVMVAYRRHILSSIRSWGSARGLVHYRQYVEAYLYAKHLYLHWRLHRPDPSCTSCAPAEGSPSPSLLSSSEASGGQSSQPAGSMRP